MALSALKSPLARFTQQVNGAQTAGLADGLVDAIWGGFRKRNLNHVKPSATCGGALLLRAKRRFHLRGTLDLVAL
jgi:hypothetical protein